VLGARNPGNDLAGVPEVSRALVRQAIVADPDRQQVQLLAYSRRADELLRLRELPATPSRAVVDYVEQSQARAAETASAPPAPDSATAPATAVSEPPATTVASTSAATPTADAPAAPAAAAVASPSTDTPSAVALAPLAIGQPASPPPAAAVAAAPVGAPADAASASAREPSAAPTETPAASTAAPAPSGDAKVAAVQTGASATAEAYGPEQPKTDGKHRRAKVVHPHPPKAKKKPQVTVANPRAPVLPLSDFAATPSSGTRPSSGFAATPLTGFSVNQPNNRNNTPGGGWRYDNTVRQRPAPSQPDKDGVKLPDHRELR